MKATSSRNVTSIKVIKIQRVSNSGDTNCVFWELNTLGVHRHLEDKGPCWDHYDHPQILHKHLNPFKPWVCIAFLRIHPASRSPHCYSGHYVEISNCEVSFIHQETDSFSKCLLNTHSRPTSILRVMNSVANMNCIKHLHYRVLKDTVFLVWPNPLFLDDNATKSLLGHLGHVKPRFSKFKDWFFFYLTNNKMVYIHNENGEFRLEAFFRPTD